MKESIKNILKTCMYSHEFCGESADCRAVSIVHQTLHYFSSLHLRKTEHSHFSNGFTGSLVNFLWNYNKMNLKLNVRGTI